MVPLLNKLIFFQCLEFIKSALNSVTSTTIKNCFTKAKFEFNNQISDSEESIESNSFDFWPKLSEFSNVDFESFDDYVAVDENEIIEFENLDDQDILSEVQSTNDIEISSDEESVHSEELITRSKAFEYISGLKKYFCQIGDNSFDEKLEQIHKTIVNNSFDLLKQTKISDYFN